MQCKPRLGHAPCKLACAVALISLAAGSACDGCSSSGRVEREAPRSRSAAAVSIRDALGRRVRLARPARRIASLSPSASEILFSVGCGGRIVLRDKASDYPPAVRRIPATDPFSLSAEHIAGFRPDLVLLSHVDARRTEGLRAVGLRVAVFHPHTVEQVLGDIGSISALCGAPAAGRELVADLNEKLARIARLVRGKPRPRVYVELDGGDPLKPWTVGRRSFVHDVLRRAGGKNAFASIERSAVQVSAEEVVRAAPDAVLLLSAKRSRRELDRRPGWRGLGAVRRGAVIDDIEPALLARPGPRLAAGVGMLARALHPGAFAAPGGARAETASSQAGN